MAVVWVKDCRATELVARLESGRPWYGSDSSQLRAFEEVVMSANAVGGEVRGRLTPLAVVAGIVTVVLGCGGKVDEYAASQVMTRNGRQQHASTLYVSGAKMRVDMPHPSGRGSLVTIVRQDRQVVWMLFPEQKAYRETGIDSAELGALARSVDSTQVVEELGAETVAGYPCRKVKLRTKVTVLGRTVESTSTAWISPRFDLPLRSEHEGGAVTEVKDIAPGSQPAELFEVPTGFRKVEGFLPGMLDPGDGGPRDKGKGSDLADKLRDLARRH
jgi:hypothetical protein